MSNLSLTKVSLLVLGALLVGAIAGGGTSAIRAQPPAAGSVCVEISGINSLRNLNETIRRQEALGYELSMFANPAVPCFRRR